MKKLAFALMALAVPAMAAAPSNQNILNVVAMPLATAAVSDVGGIPHDEIRSLAGTLNEALVPPAQFVAIMRYAPVALTTHPPTEPSFVEFVQARTVLGVTGEMLVRAIDAQLPVYGVTARLQTSAVPPPHVAANDQDFFPPEVQAHFEKPATTTAMQTPVGPLAGNPYVPAPGIGRTTEILRPMMSAAPPNATGTVAAQTTTTASTKAQQQTKGGERP